MMPAKFDLYSAWIDPYFYAWGLLFAAALFSMVYSIRRYLELKNAEEDGEDAGEHDPAGRQGPAELNVTQYEGADAEEKTLVLPPSEQAWAPEAPQQEQPHSEPEPAEQPVQQELPQYEEEPRPEAEQPAYAEAAPQEDPSAAGEDHTRAENFVRGIYAGITGLDARMKAIEESLSKGRINTDFAVKFLEDILQDFDTLEKSKIKARIEYLVSDLKK